MARASATRIPDTRRGQGSGRESLWLRIHGRPVGRDSRVIGGEEQCRGSWVTTRRQRLPRRTPERHAGPASRSGWPVVRHPTRESAASGFQHPPRAQPLHAVHCGQRDRLSTDKSQGYATTYAQAVGRTLKCGSREEGRGAGRESARRAPRHIRSVDPGYVPRTSPGGPQRMQGDPRLAPAGRGSSREIGGSADRPRRSASAVTSRFPSRTSVPGP